MLTEKIATFPYEVEPFEDDYTGRLSWGVLGKHILASAKTHADARGFDRVVRDGRPYLWVLSRMIFEMEAWPELGDQYTISTWINSYHRYFTKRCFDIRDVQGTVIGKVSTVWAMIDGVTRKPQMLDDLVGKELQIYMDEERNCDIAPFSRIRIKNETPTYSRPTYYSDIDENDHVNSIRYIEFVLDAFPKEIFRTHQVSRLEIAYNAECYCGEPLSFFVEQPEEDHYHVIIKKNALDAAAEKAEIVCHSAVKFKKLAQPRQTLSQMGNEASAFQTE